VNSRPIGHRVCSMIIMMLCVSCSDQFLPLSIMDHNTSDVLFAIHILKNATCLVTYVSTAIDALSTLLNVCAISVCCMQHCQFVV
jgi:hypothetical protein